MLLRICTDTEGGTGGPDPPPLKIHKNIGFLSKTGADPLKMTRLPSQNSMSGHHRHASETPFKWRVAGPWKHPKPPQTTSKPPQTTSKPHQTTFLAPSICFL